MKPQLSILILTTPRRRDNYAQRLLLELERQERDLPDIKKVEILCLYDDYSRSVGAKRNALVSIANGEYICFIDDDDSVAPTYIRDILKAIESDADVIVFDVDYFVNDKKNMSCKYGINFEPRVDKPRGEWFGKPAHIHVFKSRFFKDFSFSDINNGEDMDWVKKVIPNLKTEERINKVLYEYRFSPDTTEAQGPLKVKK